MVRVRTRRSLFVVRVDGVAEKRVSAKLARELFTETDESREERERQADMRRSAPPLGSDLGRRPTKRDRRRIDRLRRG